MDSWTVEGKISMKKKILITGSGGFIGRNLKEHFEKKYAVKAPRHSELDLLDEKEVEAYLKKNKFDVVIHCATHNATANSKKDISQVFKNNLRMFFNLARCNNLYGKMFYFGSGAEYDKRFYVPKMKEEYFDTYVPEDDYGFSKYISAKYIEDIPNIYDLRIFGCFGKYEDWEIRFISNALCKAMYDLDITMRKNVFFDYLYINDLCTIMDLFIETKKLKYTYYNVCTGRTIDLKSLAANILNITGKKVKINVGAKGLNTEYSGDNSRLLAEFKNIQFTPIEVAIKELYNWYVSQKSSIDPKLLLVDK